MQQINWLLKLSTISVLLSLSFLATIDSTAQTWSNPINISKIGSSVSPAIAIDSSGNIHVVWEYSFIRGNSTGSTIFYSRWNGTSWSGPINISKNFNVSANPAIEIDSSGNPHVVWQDYEIGEIAYCRGLANVSPILSITTPTSNHILATGAKLITLTVAIVNHTEHWHWKLNESFPKSGSAGGNMVMSGNIATITGLKNGQSYTVYATLVDANHNVLSPPVTTSVTFSIAASPTGDVSGNGSVEPFDASLILQYTVGLIKLPNSLYPDFTLKTADVSGDGTIDPFDASLILRYSVGKIKKFPVEEKGASPPIIPLFSENNPTIRLGVPYISDDSVFTFPVLVSGAEGILSGKLTFSYIPHFFIPLVVNLDESISEHLYTYQFESDKVYVSLAGSTPLNGNQSLFELKFKLLSNSIPAGTNLVNILEAQFNEGQFIAKVISSKVIPKTPILAQNFPNPFNPETWIPYQLAKSADVNIRIYDISGKLVRILNLGRKDVGLYVTKERAAYWDGRNDADELVASGVYFYTIQAGDFIATRRMVIIR